MVVLPFANLSNDPDQEYFADGITDDLTTDLSRISGSFVIARNTAFTYKGKPVDVKQLGRELGVRYVIEGSARRIGDQVLVNVQLVDGETAAHLWAERFETDLRNPLEAQSEITGRLARTLNVEVTRAVGRRVEREGGSDPDARDLAMRARGLISGGYSAAISQAAQLLYEHAPEKDPESIDAKTGIARVLVQRIVNGWSKSIEQDEARVERLLIEALERDPNDAQLHEHMGTLRRSQNRLTEARAELETAVALDRNDTFAVRNLGLTLLQLGQPVLAIPYYEKSLRLSPRDPYVAANYSGLGRCHLYLGHTEQAIDFLTKARAANPKLDSVHFNLVAALSLRGDLSEARAALTAAISLKSDLNSVAAFRGSSPAFNSSPFWALIEKTLVVGLRRIGFPDE